MAVRFTHKRMSPGYNDHEHITHLRWVDATNSSSTGSNTKAELVTWVDEGNVAWVGTGSSAVRVAVVRPSSGEAYLRTHADGKYTNNVLNLPDH